MKRKRLKITDQKGRTWPIIRKIARGGIYPYLLKFMEEADTEELRMAIWEGLYLRERRAEERTRRAMMEIISAKSSLNMYPEPAIDDRPQEEQDERPLYLSEADKWAAHSYHHMNRAALELNGAPRRALPKRDRFGGK